MSGTQYDIDQGLLTELNGNCRKVALEFAKRVPLKLFLQFKYSHKDTFQYQPFSRLSPVEKLLVVNAVIVYRLSCIDNIYFFSEAEIDLVIAEYLSAYEESFDARERHYIDLQEELNKHYPRAAQWLLSIDAQSRANKRYQEMRQKVS